MNESISGIISILATFQLLFASLFLITHRKGNKRNNRLLGLIFLLFSISLADFSLRINGILFPNPVWHLIDEGFFFLYGPLLYLYVKGVVYLDFKMTRKVLLHFIPFGFYIVYLVYSMISIDAVQQDQLSESILSATLPTWLYLASLSIYVYNLIYIWLAAKTVRTYRIVIKNKYSSVHQISLKWLSFIIQSFAAITIIAMIHNVIPALGSMIFLYVTLLFLLVYTFFFINRVLIKALRQPEIFAGIELEEAREKYAGSNLKEKETSELYDKLQTILMEEKLYLNEDLTLQDLADRIPTSSKFLSQVINQCSEKNYFDYINTFRCQEVKSIMISADPKVTILEIMYQSGFNSKSSFNKEFKKLNGTTPSEYRKLNRKT
jgi:AraC-like DNA-binding protein